MVVNVMGSLQKLFVVVKSDEEGDGHADGAPQGVPAADPIPKLKHVVLRVDAKLAHLHLVGGQGDEMLGHRRCL